MKKEKNNTSKCPICGRPTHKDSKYCIFHASAEEKTKEEFKEALKAYISKIKKDNRDYDFERFIFIGEINFKEDLDITVFKNADFENATFKGHAIFGGATFLRRDANFKGATFEGNAYFQKVTFEGNASFQKVTFKGDAYFQKATFEGRNFFKMTIVKGDAYFKKATFEGSASFQEVTFEGSASFQEATFGGDVNFNKVTFEGSTSFYKATFGGDTYFYKATFKRGASFREATFGGDVNFNKVTFEGRASFYKVTFEGYSSFQEATFGGDVDFNKATFKENVDFKVKTFVEEIIFKNIMVLSGKKLNIKVENSKGKISFERAYLENIYLELKLSINVLIDFSDTLLRNTQIKKDQIENHILHEKKKEFSRAKEIYLLLKNNFHSIGKYNDESWAYKKEEDMDRLSHSYSSYIEELKRKDKKEKLPILKWIQKGNFKKWIISAFSNMIYGYGERPWNVVRTAVVIIIIFALSFSFIGLGNPEIIELKGTAIHQNSGNMVELVSKGLLKNNVIRNFPDSLYFSTITFTTLGYGDFRPLEGLGRILAGSEAFLGAIMMALFVYTFARRTGGR